MSMPAILQPEPEQCGSADLQERADAAQRSYRRLRPFKARAGMINKNKSKIIIARV